jgi:hypothetical protein
MNWTLRCINGPHSGWEDLPACPDGLLAKFMRLPDPNHQVQVEALDNLMDLEYEGKTVFKTPQLRADLQQQATPKSSAYRLMRLDSDSHVAYYVYLGQREVDWKPADEATYQPPEDDLPELFGGEPPPLTPEDL